MVDIEEAIPALIAVFGVLGFIGFLGEFFPVINSIPFLFSGPHYVFTLLGSLLEQFVAIGPSIWAAIFEVAVIAIFAFISYQIGG